jgi:transglutaminase-like putative cysteine protease
MQRRDFLRTAGFAPALLCGKTATGSAWRTFEVTTRVEVLEPSGATRVWVPAALPIDTPYQRTLARSAVAEGGRVFTFENKTDALAIVCAEFPAGIRPILTVKKKIATQDRTVPLGEPVPHRTATDLSHWLRPTKLLPTGGIVKENAEAITAHAKTDLDKARAIYEWIVENTARNPKTPGCGRGDIRSMLETRDLSGKCADLNSLFVGLCRAAGLPARDVYGIRVAQSNLGYKSLGVSSAAITKAQHCRAEVYLGGYGWVPADPADVRKVMLEEPPGHRPLDDEMVRAARARLFGSWEMNWIAYNFAHDVTLPGSQGPTLPFLMYPQAETAQGRIDCLNPDAFRYEISSSDGLGR